MCLMDCFTAGHSVFSRSHISCKLGKGWRLLFLLIFFGGRKVIRGFPGGTSGKEPSRQCRRCKRLGLGRSPGGGNGNLLQLSCLENPMDRGAWRAAIHSVAQSRKWLKRFSMHAWRRLRKREGCLFRGSLLHTQAPVLLNKMESNGFTER